MLLRLIASPVKRLVRLPARTLSTSTALSSGHGDHHEPTPVYIPRPAAPAKGWFESSSKVPSMYPAEPYKPGPDDFASYAGAGVFVALTCLAVVFYTDVFGMNIKSKDAHTTHAKAAHHPEPVKEAAPKPVVEKVVKEEVPVEKKTVEVEKVAEVQPEAKAEVEVEPNGPAPVVVEEESKPAPVEEVAKEEPVKEVKEPVSEPVVETPKAEPVSEQASTSATTSESAKESSESTTSAAKKIPESVEYLLIGAGTASYYAALAIRARDADAKVLIVGEESHLPYNRPPLSKELWWYGDEKTKDTLEYKALSGKKRDIYLEAKGFFVPPTELNDARHGGVSLLSGRRVVRLCPDEKKAFLDDDTVISYSKCLVATGGKPKSVPELDAAGPKVQERILYFRGVDDYRKLEELCGDAKTITVVGGGFLGSELAYGIKRKYENLEINQVVAEGGHLSNILPEYLSKKATESIKRVGVNVLTNAKITGAKKSGDKVELQLSGATEKNIKSDYVLVAVGIEPNTSLAEASGLEIDSTLGGVAADAELRVRSGIYAAGDACSFYDKSLGRRRVEHWENAQISGRLAGENMTGGEKAFWYQPSFFTKISPEHHINAVGNTDASLKTVSVFAKDESHSDKHYERGVVFYKGTDDRVVGVLLINVFGPSIDVARRLIEEARPVGDYRELSKLFPLFEATKEEEEKK